MRDIIPSFLGHQPSRVTLDGNFKNDTWHFVFCIVFCFWWVMTTLRWQIVHSSWNLCWVWMLGTYEWPSLSTTACILIAEVVHLFKWGIYIDTLWSLKVHSLHDNSLSVVHSMVSANVGWHVSIIVSYRDFHCPKNPLYSTYLSVSPLIPW